MNMNYLASVAFACTTYALLFAYGVVQNNVTTQALVVASVALAWTACYAGYAADVTTNATRAKNMYLVSAGTTAVAVLLCVAALLV